MSFGGSSFGGVPFDASNTGRPAVGSAAPNTASVDLRAIQDWPGKGPFGILRAKSAWPKFQFPYPSLVRLTQQYAEALTSGDPSLQEVRVTHQYVEVVSDGDPTLQEVRVTQQYVEVIHTLFPQYSYLGAQGGEWPGRGPNRRERFRGDILNKGFPPRLDASPTLTAAPGSGAVNGLVPSESKSLTAATGAGATGNVAPKVAPNLTAVHGTAANGQVVPSVAPSLTAIHAAGVIGTITAGVGPNLTASHGSGAVSSLVPSVSHSLTAATGAGTTDSVTPKVAPSLTATHGTAAVNSFDPQIGGGVTVALASVAGIGATNIDGIKEQIALSGAHGTGAAGSLTANTGSRTVLIPAHGTGRANQFGVSISVSSTKTHGKSQGHGKGQGPQSILRVDLGDVFATGRANALGFAVHSSTAVNVGLIGVAATGKSSDFSAVRIDENAALSSSVGAAAVDRVAPGVSIPLTAATANGARGALAPRISPNAALSGVAATGSTDVFSLIIASGSDIDDQLPAQRALGRTGQFGISIARDLQDVNVAVGAVADIARETVDAGATLGEALAFSGVGEFGIDLSVALASIAAAGTAGRAGVHEILPQEPLTCDLHASVNFGDLGATANVGDLEATATPNNLGASGLVGAMRSQIKTNDLGAGLRCN